MSGRTISLGILAAAAVLLCCTAAQAEFILNENFNTVTGQGGGPVLIGSGFNWVTNWDNGITGEQAFAGTTGYARVGAISASGAPTGGVNGTGAGVLDVSGVNFNMVDEAFNSVSGTGGGMFLTGDGTPDTSGYTLNWDDGITGERAFAGTFGGAAIQSGGGAAALGLPTGGMSGTGAGRIVMSNVAVGTGNWYAGLEWDLAAFPGASPFYNPSFENGTASWTLTGNALIVPGYDVPVTPHSGDHVLKMFGTFPGNSFAYQDVPAQAGQVWSLAAFTQHVSTDSLVNTANHVDMSIEFRDPNGTLLDSGVVTILSAASPTNTWLTAGPLQRTAPAGTVSARALFTFVQPSSQGGAGLVDDVTFTIVGGPQSINLSQHALTADIKGTANTGAGEVLGDYQLRIEDSNRNRLIFRGTANGNWQSVGGPLSTAIEADPNGVPTPGVFNVNSPTFAVVAALDDQYTHRWGTGGTLTVDNVRLTNTNSTGSVWYAGFDWPNLIIPPADLNDLSKLQLKGDVLGNVNGGKYQLRIEAMKNISSGLNESFNAVHGDCGAGGRCKFLDPNDVAGGVYNAFTGDWDTGLTGEGAFAGVYGGTGIFTDGGFTARGLTTGGTNGTGAGEIRVEDIILGPPGAGWYAGLNWINQRLASTNLSQVTLTVDVKGTALSGGYLGNLELRIEDADGDRMYFPATATGNWQHLGGPLSTATFGPSLGGGGNGVFDLNSPTYSVVVAFANEADTWLWGGSLVIDNLYLTPVVTQQQLGQIAFHGTANGNWQTTGGLLTQGDSSFDNLNENFNGVTGVGGGEFWQAHGSQTFGGQPWDTGITGEETFAGTWGSGTIGTENAWGCLTCGVNGTGAGNVSVTGVGGGASGGWWAGLSWVVPPPDWSNLANVLCTAQVKASKLAPFMLRVEDGSKPAALPVWLGFTHTPTTLGFEPVGGSMNQAVQGCPNPPCAAFNFNAPYYRVTLIYSGSNSDTTWGSGGQLTVDNLYFTGISFADADAYTVTLAFENEIATWGTAGQLKLDNLSLQRVPPMCRGDCNCDGTINFADINPFVAALTNPAAACSFANCDVNGDGVVNFADINPFVAKLSPGGPCAP